jgi:phage baseplate assembly protein W
MSGFDLSLSLRPAPRRSSAEELADRVRMILETERGKLPFKPEFGCELSGLVGSEASTKRLSEIRMRINSALRRWVPDGEVVSCKVAMMPVVDSGSAGGPVAERAMASHGLARVIEVRVVLESDGVPLKIEAQLS